MINKKIFCIFIAALLIFSLQLYTFAAVDITLDMDKTGFINDIVIAEGTASARTRITMLIIKPGFTLASLTEDNMMDRIVCLKQNSNIPADRHFSFTFNMKDEYPGGTYTIVIGGTDVAVSQTKTFYFVNTALRQAGLDKINNAASGKDILDNILYDTDSKAIFEMIGFSYTDFSAVINKESVCNKLFASRPYTGGASGELRAATVFNQNTFLTIINEAGQSDKQAKLELYAAKLGIDITKGSVYSYLTGIEKESIAWDKLKIINFSDVTDLQNKFTEITTLTIFNEGTYGIIGDILPLVSTYLGITLSSYNNLTDEQKIVVNKAVVGLDSVSAIKKAFDNAVSGSTATPTNSGSSQRPSSSSGSSGTIGAYGGGANEYRPISEPAPIKEDPVEFSDVPASHWAKESIDYLAEKKIINGFGDGSFMPDEFITREQFTAIIVKAFEIGSSQAGADFNDVGKNEWYSGFISTASSAGIIKGTEEGIFGLGLNIIRQDMAVMLMRTCELKGINLPLIKDDPSFSDFSDVSDYSVSAISFLYKAGILNGSEQNEIMPLNETTRAQVAKVVYEVLKLLNK